MEKNMGWTDGKTWCISTIIYLPPSEAIKLFIFGGKSSTWPTFCLSFCGWDVPKREWTHNSMVTLRYNMILGNNGILGYPIFRDWWDIGFQRYVGNIETLGCLDIIEWHATVASNVFRQRSFKRLSQRFMPAFGQVLCNLHIGSFHLCGLAEGVKMRKVSTLWISLDILDVETWPKGNTILDIFYFWCIFGYFGCSWRSVSFQEQIRILTWVQNQDYPTRRWTFPAELFLSGHPKESKALALRKWGSNESQGLARRISHDPES